MYLLRKFQMWTGLQNWGEFLSSFSSELQLLDLSQLEKNSFLSGFDIEEAVILHIWKFYQKIFAEKQS